MYWKTYWKTAGGALGGVLWGSAALADVGGDGSGGHMHWMGDGWSHGLFGPIMMVIAVVAVVVIVMAVLRAVGAQGATPPQATQTSPLDILKARFARGEVDQEEFESRRRTLES